MPAFLEKQGDASLLEGWLGQSFARGRTMAVADHDLWPYFARRFLVDVVGFLEPKPGVPPTTRHLGLLVEAMKARQVGLVLTAPYYDPRHAAFVAESTGARVVALVHQCGAKPGVPDYLAAIEWNVRALAAAAAAPPK